MGIERHGDCWHWVGGPVPRGMAAMTIGPLISLRRSAVGDARLLRHELVHVRQWRELGFIRFAVRYLGAYVHWRLRGWPHLAAYRRIPLEVEAEWESRMPAVPR